MSQNPLSNITEQLTGAGFDHAVAIATQAEIEAGSACGQLSIITEKSTDEV